MTHRWVLPGAATAACQRLADQLQVSPLLAQCLLNRGLETPARAHAFLEPRLRSLADPARLPNLERAVERLWCARERGEPLVVFGDYDVDGVTATALLMRVLPPLGWHVAAYLPRRLDEGYGLTRAAAQACLDQHPVPLLLAVDCGSTAVATVAWLAQRGVEVIVLDHHQVAAPYPDAVALVNPHLPATGAGDFRELSSVGVAFKLAHALVRRGRQTGLPAAARFDVRPLLDLVALGTIADLVPLTGENRPLVTAGLTRLNQAPRPGIAALRAVAGVTNPLGPIEVAFQLAPRLNAAGRLQTAATALDLLLADDLARAEPLAQALDASNRERQAVERRIAEDLLPRLRARFNAATDYVLVEGDPHWHLGVVGIVASRVLQEFYRPTLILGGDGQHWRGSGRSIEGFDLAAALRQCADLLVRHGGHAMAAGVTVEPGQIPALRARLNALARATLGPAGPQPTLRLDAEVGLAELTPERLLELERLQPHGQGNPPVQLIARGVALCRPPQRLGRDQRHLKLWVRQNQAACETLWWGGAHQPWPPARFDLAFAPQLHRFNGRQTVQLKLLDWRPVPGDAGTPEEKKLS